MIFRISLITLFSVKEQRDLTIHVTYDETSY